MMILTKRAFCLGLLIVLAVETGGCSFFGPKWQTISVMSEPPGAEVIIDGLDAGLTPLRHNVRRDEESALIIRKEGYEPAERQLIKGLSTLGYLDVVGGLVWFVPFFGLLAPGAWEQAPANIAVILAPNPQGN